MRSVPRTLGTSVTINSGASLSGAIDVSQYIAGIVHFPAAWTTARLGYYVASTTGGTFLPYSNSTGLVQVTNPAVSNAYELPDGLAAARWLKLSSQNSTGVAVNQLNTARVLILDFYG